MNSLNHYAYGAIGEWIYERIGGIAPIEAGYKSIRIAPIPKEPLTSATASLQTPYGLVSSSWEIIGDEFHLHAIIPPNTTALINIPYKSSNKLVLNGVKFKDNSKIKISKITTNSFELKAITGEYKLITIIK